MTFLQLCVRIHECSTKGSFTGGDAGDSLSQHNKMAFSTRGGHDYDTRRNGSCADDLGYGGFWLHNCNTVGINDNYSNHSDGHGPLHAKDVMSWSHWHGAKYSLKATKMMIREQRWGVSSDDADEFIDT